MNYEDLGAPGGATPPDGPAPTRPRPHQGPPPDQPGWAEPLVLVHRPSSTRSCRGPANQRRGAPARRANHGRAGGGLGRRWLLGYGVAGAACQEVVEPVSRGAGGVRGYDVPLCAGVRGGSARGLRGGRSGEPGGGSSISRGDREGSGLSIGADRHGPRSFATPDTRTPFRGPLTGPGARPQSPSRAPGLPGLPVAQLPVSPAAAGAARSARRPQASGLSAARSPGCTCSLGPCAFQASFRDTLHAVDAPFLCGVLGRVV